MKVLTDKPDVTSKLFREFGVVTCSWKRDSSTQGEPYVVEVTLNEIPRSFSSLKVGLEVLDEEHMPVDREFFEFKNVDAGKAICVSKPWHIYTGKTIGIASVEGQTPDGTFILSTVTNPSLMKTNEPVPSSTRVGRFKRVLGCFVPGCN